MGAVSKITNIVTVTVAIYIFSSDCQEEQKWSTANSAFCMAKKVIFTVINFRMTQFTRGVKFTFKGSKTFALFMSDSITLKHSYQLR